MLDRIEPLIPAHASQVAELDLSSRPDDFLPSLGRGFLTALFTQLLSGSETWGYGAFDAKGRLLGFVVCCRDVREAFRRLSPFANPRMFLATASALVRRPSRILKMAESLFYTSHESSHIAAELLVMGVRQGLRSHGLGSELVYAAAREARRRGLASWRVTVKTRNDRAIRFYIRNGFRLTATFQMYGEGWEEMVADLGQQLSVLSARAQQAS